MEVGVDLVLHVAGEESEFLACLDGRTREDDLLGRLLLEGLDGEGNAQIGLARTCRSDGKDHVVALVCVDEFLLVGRARLDGAARHAIDQHALHAVGLRQPALHDVEDILLAELVVLQQVLTQQAHAFLEAGHFFFVAEQADHVAASYDAQFGVERLEHLEMAVANSEECHRVDVLQYDMLLYQSTLYDLF